MIKVVDASVVVGALVDDAPTGRWCDEQIELAEVVAAPHLMPFEVANVIRRMTARSALEKSEGAAALHDLLRLAIDLVPFAPLADRAWELGENLTSYDACYAALAEWLDCPLLTLDRRLGEAPGLRCEVLVAP